ncbi:MAG: hypothetical protein H7247_18145 [Polaromonas sp.]|nr:hypothetical protein [Gemmatimonadaceae bacterium]
MIAHLTGLAKRSTVRTIGLLLLACLTACSPARGLQSDESVVQAAVIDSLFVRDTTRQVVVGDSTVREATSVVDSDYAHAIQWLAPLPLGLRSDFERKRKLTERVDRLATRVPMQRFTNADRASGSRQYNAFWSAFFHRYPGSPGRIEVSRVGFGRDGTSALVHVEYACGGLCGGTIYVLLAKRSGKWHVIRTAEPRMS